MDWLNMLQRLVELKKTLFAKVIEVSNMVIDLKKGAAETHHSVDPKKRGSKMVFPLDLWPEYGQICLFCQQKITVFPPLLGVPTLLRLFLPPKTPPVLRKKWRGGRFMMLAASVLLLFWLVVMLLFVFVILATSWLENGLLVSTRRFIKVLQWVGVVFWGCNQMMKSGLPVPNPFFRNAGNPPGGKHSQNEIHKNVFHRVWFATAKQTPHPDCLTSSTSSSGPGRRATWRLNLRPPGDFAVTELPNSWTKRDGCSQMQLQRLKSNLFWKKSMCDVPHDTMQ